MPGQIREVRRGKKIAIMVVKWGEKGELVTYRLSLGKFE
jgi:hypothetical protein